MRDSLEGIDHVVIAVRDLDHARDTYSRMGFSLTPRGFHTLGSQNHCAMFDEDYLELLAVPRPHPVNQYFIEFLARAEGLAAVSMASNDAHDLHRSFGADGIPADEPVEFSRPVESDTGTRDARFRVAQLAPEATPGCRSFVCQHLTRELVWRSDRGRHPLGVVGVAGITVLAGSAAQAAGVAAAYSRVWGSPVVERDATFDIAAGAATITVTTVDALHRRDPDFPLPARAAPLVGVLTLRTLDRDQAERVLRDGGFAPKRMDDGALAIDAARAHGVTLVFR